MTHNQIKTARCRAIAAAVWAVFITGSCALAEDALPQVERLKSSPVLQHLKPNPLSAPPAALRCAVTSPSSCHGIG